MIHDTGAWASRAGARACPTQDSGRAGPPKGGRGTPPRSVAAATRPEPHGPEPALSNLGFRPGLGVRALGPGHAGPMKKGTGNAAEERGATATGLTQGLSLKGRSLNLTCESA
eukprot:5979323-Alexandrium_andersonii.AAC.1